MLLMTNIVKVTNHLHFAKCKINTQFLSGPPTIDKVDCSLILF